MQGVRPELTYIYGVLESMTTFLVPLKRSCAPLSLTTHWLIATISVNSSSSNPSDDNGTIKDLVALSILEASYPPKVSPPTNECTSLVSASFRRCRRPLPAL